MHLSLITENIDAIWAELLNFGHDHLRVSPGIWDGPRLYEIRFLTNDQVVASMLADLTSAADFDALRSYTKQLTSELAQD